jgi:hypothetical protein
MLTYLMGMSARRRLHVPVLVAALAAVAWLPAPARADSAPQFTSKPVVQGDPVVGSTVTAVATWTGDPIPDARYTWGRCPATSNICPVIAGATGVNYLVTQADLGSRLAVRIDLYNDEGSRSATSGATAVVTAPPAAQPPPAPQPPPPAAAPVVPVKISASSAVRRRLPFLDPFPVVRIRGFFARSGARITLLSVRGPRNAQVNVRCVGRGCPVNQVTLPTANVRVHRFERFLRAGIQLQIRVTRPGRIGSYTSFLIRSRKAPLRTERCLTASGRPIRCSAP